MSIIKNHIPLLEYDSNPQSVIMPDHEKLGVSLPEKAVFAFLSDHIDAYALSNRGRKIAEFITITKTFPIYAVEYSGQEVCLCQAPLGAAAAAQMMDWLIGYGVKNIISAGCCGALEDIPENTFLVPVKALRDEGASYHYLPTSRFVYIRPHGLKAIEAALRMNHYNYIECVTWSTDGFYRETAEKVAYRKAEGCSVVEMECSALAACAEFRKVNFGQILFTADTLADTDNYCERDWGKDSFDIALHLCLEAVIRM